MTADVLQFPDLKQQPEDVKAPEQGDQQFWSVTTIIGCLDKPALMYWAAEETGKAAIATLGSLKQRVEEDGEEETVKWLRDARFRRPKDKLSAASLGTAGHAGFEVYALTGVRPTVSDCEGFVRAEGGPKMPKAAIEREAVVVGQMLDRFAEFLEDFQPEYIATEVTVYSPTYGYAGQSDLFARIGGVPLIGDYKTSRDPKDGKGNWKTPYPEVALQLAAYRHAEMAAVWRPRRFESFRRRYYLLSQQEREMAMAVPEVDGGVCIHITPERYGVFPVQCDEEMHQAFLNVQEAAHFQFEASKRVIGGELIPPAGKDV